MPINKKDEVGVEYTYQDNDTYYHYTDLKAVGSPLQEKEPFTRIDKNKIKKHFPEEWEKLQDLEQEMIDHQKRNEKKVSQLQKKYNKKYYHLSKKIDKVMREQSELENHFVEHQKKIEMKYVIQREKLQTRKKYLETELINKLQKEKTETDKRRTQKKRCPNGTRKNVEMNTCEKIN